MRHPGLYKLPIGDREKKDNLGISEAKFAPSPSRPVEARAPAHRYVALALGWRVSVLEGEIVVEEGHRPPTSFLKGGSRHGPPHDEFGQY